MIELSVKLSPKSYILFKRLQTKMQNVLGTEVTEDELIEGLVETEALRHHGLHQPHPDGKAEGSDVKLLPTGRS